MSGNEKSGHREILEEFLRCYKSETCLWQTKSKEYHDRNKKVTAYNRLIEKYKIIEPKANRELVVKKINNFRTAYKRELNKVGKSNKYTPRLWYFDMLHFLNDQEVPNIIEVENEYQSSETSQESDFSSQSQCLQQSRNSESGSELDTPKPNRRSRAVKRTSNEEVLKSMNAHFKRPRIYENRFQVYGRNVGLKLQELPQQQRILAEKLINEALFLAEMGSLTMSHTVKISELINTTFSTQPHCKGEDESS